MPPKAKQTISDVKSVTFENAQPSQDGEKIVSRVRDKSGGVGHIAIDWSHIGIMLQIIHRGTEKVSEVREALSKPN